MQILIDNPDEDSVNSFLIVSHSADPTLSRNACHYEVSTQGVRIGHLPEETFPKAEPSIKKPTFQILFRHGYFSWEDLASHTGTRVHGIITQKQSPENKEMTQIGRFAFEFGTEKLKPSKISTELYRFTQKNMLTGIYQSSYLKHLLEWEIEKYRKLLNRRKKDASFVSLCSLSLLQVKIDRFEEICQQLQSLELQAFFQKVAKYLSERVRSTDIMADWDDGFLIYLPNTQAKKASDLAENLQKRIERTSFTLREQIEMKITVSIGVATYKPTMTLEAFIEESKRSLLEGKQKRQANLYKPSAYRRPS